MMSHSSIELSCQRSVSLLQNVPYLHHEQQKKLAFHVNESEASDEGLPECLSHCDNLSCVACTKKQL